MFEARPRRLELPIRPARGSFRYVFSENPAETAGCYGFESEIFRRCPRLGTPQAVVAAPEPQFTCVQHFAGKRTVGTCDSGSQALITIHFEHEGQERLSPDLGKRLIQWEKKIWESVPESLDGPRFVCGERFFFTAGE
jgi:hypothetical protein